jgi:hypothetical protein
VSRLARADILSRDDPGLHTTVPRDRVGSQRLLDLVAGVCKRCLGTLQSTQVLRVESCRPSGPRFPKQADSCTEIPRREGETNLAVCSAGETRGGRDYGCGVEVLCGKLGLGPLLSTDHTYGRQIPRGKRVHDTGRARVESIFAMAAKQASTP